MPRVLDEIDTYKFDTQGRSAASLSHCWKCLENVYITGSSRTLTAHAPVVSRLLLRCLNPVCFSCFAGWVVFPSRFGADELSALTSADEAGAAEWLATHGAALAVARELVGGGDDDGRFMVDESFHRAQLPREEPSMVHWGSVEPTYFKGGRGQRFTAGLRLVAALADAP